MTTEQYSKLSGTEGPPATDHREIEWQFDTDELDPVEGWLVRQASGSSGPTVALDIFSERCSRQARDLRVAVPDAKSFRVLTKGKEWKKFEKVLEDQKAFNVPDTGVR